MIKTICFAISAIFAFLSQPFTKLPNVKSTVVSYTVAENIKSMSIDAVVFDSSKFNSKNCCKSKIYCDKNIDTTDAYHFVYDSLDFCAQKKFDQSLTIVININDAMTKIIQNPQECKNCIKACKDFVQKYPKAYEKIIFIIPGKESASYIAMEKILNDKYVRHHRFNEALTDPCISLLLDKLNF